MALTSSEDLARVYTLLQDALRQDEATRKPAEATLAACENRPGFCSCLLVRTIYCREVIRIMLCDAYMYCPSFDISPLRESCCLALPKKSSSDLGISQTSTACCFVSRRDGSSLSFFWFPTELEVFASFIHRCFVFTNGLPPFSTLY